MLLLQNYISIRISFYSFTMKLYYEIAFREKRRRIWKMIYSDKLKGKLDVIHHHTGQHIIYSFHRLRTIMIKMLDGSFSIQDKKFDCIEKSEKEGNSSEIYRVIRKDIIKKLSEVIFGIRKSDTSIIRVDRLAPFIERR